MNDNTNELLRMRRELDEAHESIREIERAMHDMVVLADERHKELRRVDENMRNDFNRFREDEDERGNRSFDQLRARLWHGGGGIVKAVNELKLALNNISDALGMEPENDNK